MVKLSETALIKQQYVTINLAQQAINIHYRFTGEQHKTPIILLHPSPLSSTFMEPMLSLFGQSHKAIAWDSPGYGNSDKLAESKQSLAPYIDSLALFMDALEIDSAIIYGNATGAQIAVEFAKKYPNKAQRLILENVALFNETERSEMLASYFPDLSPKEGGQHLQITWQMVERLFKSFPWYDHSPSAQLITPMPPLEVLQATFVDYVKAGKNYADAYIAAINNEKPEQISNIPVKADILLWQDSIIYRFCQRLNEIELAKHTKLHHVTSGMPARFDKLKQLLTSAMEDNND